eukprot:scaffold211474_cov19-Tisochrysis_lutea.AAC.1
MSTSLQCPHCGEPACALHIPLGCKHSTMSSMVTECHNVMLRSCDHGMIASKILLKGTSKGPYGAGLASLTWQCRLSYFTEPADP